MMTSTLLFVIFLEPTELLKPPEMMDLNKEIKEDLNGNPEENPAHFIAVLVEALFVLRKIPDSAEVYKLTLRKNRKNEKKKTFKMNE